MGKIKALVFVVSMVLLVSLVNSDTVFAANKIAKETNGYDHVIAYTGCSNQWIHIEATSSK